MSQLGFYGWIREGVRRAVLLGVSDAVGQLGTPTEGDDISHHLLAVIREHRPTALEERRAPAARGERKRLGRSLDQIVQNGPATESA